MPCSESRCCSSAAPPVAAAGATPDWLRCTASSRRLRAAASCADVAGCCGAAPPAAQHAQTALSASLGADCKECFARRDGCCIARQPPADGDVAHVMYMASSWLAMICMEMWHYQNWAITSYHGFTRRFGGLCTEKRLQCSIHLVRHSDMRRHRAQHCCRAPSWRTGPSWWCARRSGGGIQPRGRNRPRRRRWWACGSRSGCRLSATLPSLRHCNRGSYPRLCTCDATITCNWCLRRLQIPRLVAKHLARPWRRIVLGELLPPELQASGNHLWWAGKLGSCLL